MRARTHYTVVPTDTGALSAIGKALLLSAGVITVIIALLWWGEKRQVPAVPSVSVAAQTITLPTNLTELPTLRFDVEIVDNGYILTDADGDRFHCNTIPIRLTDMESCTHAGG